MASATGAAAESAHIQILAPQTSPSYDGPGPWSVSEPHRAVLVPERVRPRRGEEAGPTASRATAAAATADSACEGAQDGSGAPASAAGRAPAVRLQLTVTLPGSLRSGAGGGSGGREPPFPVIIFISGFLLRVSFYQSYAARLASWGYAVLQYDTPLLSIIEDRRELEFLDRLMTWLAEQNAAPGGFAEDRLDLSRVGVAGHSRGGKIAALHLVGDSRVSAAYLIDPVDNTSRTPEGPAYPSACRALRASGAAVGVTGASVVCQCNPEGSNYKDFFEAAGAGSWREVVAGGGHSQFCQAGWILNRLFGALCHTGPTSNTDVIQRTLPPLTAWMDLHLQPELQRREGLLERFLQWTEFQQSAGQLAFERKPEEASEEHGPINQHPLQMPVTLELADTISRTGHARENDISLLDVR